MSEQPPVPPTKRAKIAGDDDGGNADEVRGGADVGDGGGLAGAGDPFLAQAQAIHARHPLVDGHNDLAWALGNRVRLAKGNAERHAAALEHVDLRVEGHRLHTDIPKLRRGRVGIQFWSVYAPTPGAQPDKYGTHVKSEAEAVVGTLEQIDRVHRLCAKYPDVFALCDSPAAAREAFASGKVASCMGAEGGHQLANSMGTLRVLHRLGP